MGKLYKTLIYDNTVSLSILETTDIVNKAIEIHGLSPLTAAALGRTLTVCSFMASNLKNKQDKLTVNISGNGVGGRITVLGNSALQMRGEILNPSAELPLNSKGKLDVAGCVGKGRITVIKNMGLKEPYSGSCNIISGEIAEDFAAYYAYSEQQPTAMALGVKIGKNRKCIGAGGVILQPLPDCPEENIIKAERLISNFSDVSTHIENGGAEGIISKYFSQYSFVEYKPVYKCLCNKRNIDKVLISLGKEELNETLKEQGKIQVDCHFCNKKYIYLKEDVDKLFK